MKKINYFDLGLYQGNTLFSISSYLIKHYPTSWNSYGFEACELFYEYCKARFSNSSQTQIVHGAISNTEEDIKLYFSSNEVGHSLFESKNKSSYNDSFAAANNLPVMFNDFLIDDGYGNKVVNPQIPGGLPWVVEWTKLYAKSRGYIPVVYAEESFKTGEWYNVGINNYIAWHTHPVGPWLIPSPGVKNKRKYEYSKGIIFSKWLKENKIDLESSFNIMKVNIEGAEMHLFEDLVENDLVKHFDIFCGTGDDVEKITEISSDEYYKLLEENNIKIYRFSDWQVEKNDSIFDIISEKYENSVSL
tara:strand:+ start:720 stop:1628 length:909 start_codon:yes stop_codon:yes gene_type:complete